MNDPTHATLTEARIHIGQLQVEVKHLTQGMHELQESNEQLTLKVDQVLLALSEARGGWRTLMLVGGAASTAGGLLSWAVTHFSKG